MALWAIKSLPNTFSLGQLMGIACNSLRMCTRDLQTRPAERKLLVAYVETGTNS